ncbi:FERM domain-containing protein 8-like isoform X2 [Ornithodoros turicata]
MRDIVPEDDDEEEEDDIVGEETTMMKQMDRHGDGYMTPNYVTVIPVEYPRSDSSPLSVGSLRSVEDREMILERHSPYATSLPASVLRARLLTPSHHCYFPTSRDDSWRPQPRERLHLTTHTPHQHQQQQQQQPPPAPAKKQEICVYLLSKLCLCVEVENMYLATAQEIMQLIAQDETQMHFPPQLVDAFSLWMTSPLLELQLKPQHRPCLIRDKWAEYLKKYTYATKHQLDSDEPVLTLQRNVFYDKNEERKITDDKMLKMLYSEAKGNVLDGRYPCEIDDCMVLAAIQARLELGPYDALRHTPEFFRSRIREFLPEHACRSHWFLLGLGAKNGPERRLAEHFKGMSATVKEHRLHRKYLEFCWALPYYGSAFFNAQIERPVSGIAALMSHYDLPVLVGINREGLHVIDPSQPVVLMSLQYRHLSWDCAHPAQPQNPNCLPCLFLQFQQPGQNEISMVQLFSKQAVLMDALIATLVEELKKRPSWAEDEVDGVGAGTHSDEDVQIPLTAKKIRDEQGLSGKMRKLSIARFSSRGDYINSRGSLAFKNEAGRPR